ncbi:cyclophilin-like fold protein, partial [Mitsuokella jalaludinii]
MQETGAASLLVGSKAYALKWADTEAAAELWQQLPLAKTFTELHGNEKYYKLPQHL